MKSSHWILAAVGLVSLLAGVLLFQWLNPAPDPARPQTGGKPIELHAIPLTALDGTESVLGGREEPILIVNFWAPWCAPCRREIPALLQIQDEFADAGLRVLGLSFDGEAPVRRFADEYSIDYPLFLVGNRSTMYNAAFGNPSGALPFTAIVNAERDIVYRHNGELTADQLRQQLDALLNPD